MFLTNAVSASMFVDYPSTFELKEVDVSYVQEQHLDSRIGHVELAQALSEMLQQEITCNRAEAKVKAGESAIVAYTNQAMSEKAEIKFYRLDVQ
jgi:hypothetical protein